MASHTSKRIVIVGGGVAGLSIAARLAQAGLPVTVLEAGQLGVGASTRNQGWLYSGAWFAPQQIELAQMCYQSLEQTLRFCPECVEADPARMVYLFSRQETDVDRWTAAWEAAEIPYKPLSGEQLYERFPQLAESRARRGFQLPDRAMRPDVLLARLAQAAQEAGAEIRPETSVARLVQDDGRVTGVQLAAGDALAARLVVLAGNARGGSLLPDFGTQPLGPEGELGLVALKTHLLAVRPGVSTRPFCVVDAEGLNHIPHRPTSVFGICRWLQVDNTEDEQPVAGEFERIWDHLLALFPKLEREKLEVTEWAGTTVQAMRVDQIGSGHAPAPIVIDHAQELLPVENLLSVFPGRASLWAHLAEQTRSRVLEKLGEPETTIAPPPWSR